MFTDGLPISLKRPCNNSVGDASIFLTGIGKEIPLKNGIHISFMLKLLVHGVAPAIQMEICAQQTGLPTASTRHGNGQ